MRLFQRARASHALSLLLCAVLLGAMAVPAMAATDDGRSRAGQQPEQAQEEKAKKGKKKAPRSSARGSSSASAQGQSSSAAKSSNASSRGSSASAAKSSNASARGQEAAAAKSSNASPRSKGQGATAASEGKPAKAQKQKGSDADAAGQNSPAGNKGSMKVRPVGTAAHPPRNYAHLPCTVQVDFYGSPHSGATLTAVSHAPTSPTGETLLTKTMTFSQPSPNPRGNELVGTTTLDFTSVVAGLSHHEQQGYHVKLTAVQDGPQGGDVKHKVFWVDCASEAAAEDAEVEASVGSLEQQDTSTEQVASREEVERDVVAQVQGLSGQERTEVKGVTVEREAVAAVDGRVLGESGAVAAVGGRNRALAATGLGVLALALIGLFGIGGGAGMLRRFRQR